MHTTKRTYTFWAVLTALLLITISTHFLSPVLQVSTRTLLLIAAFLPFPWFVGHLIRWLKYHSRLDEDAILHGQRAALHQECAYHHSQVIASVGGLYFLLLAASWVFLNALQ